MRKIISVLLLVLLGVVGYMFFSKSQVSKNTLNVPTVAESKNLVDNKFKILAVGDSLTAGFGVSESESYPSQLEKKLLENGYSVEIVNAGISGETTAGLLDRVDFLKKQTPDIVLITIGGNDALRALPIDLTEKNISEIVRSFKNVVSSKKIFLMNIQSPGNSGIGYLSRFNKIHKNIAQKEGVNLVPFVVPEVFSKDDYMTNDGIHPNGLGYKYLVENYIYSAVIKQLK